MNYFVLRKLDETEAFAKSYEGSWKEQSGQYYYGSYFDHIDLTLCSVLLSLEITDQIFSQM